MPKLTKTERERLPGTLERSDEKAQRTFIHTLESAEETYDGDERRAHRAAYGAVKHSYERVGDHWEAKQRRGPSDERSEQTGRRAREGVGKTAGGVDANASKAHLIDVAGRLHITGRWRMTKAQLVDAIGRANDRRAAAARSDD